jgi:hypothetical protein
MIFGWLGSTNDEFDSLSSHYRQSYPSCRVLTTVAGGGKAWLILTKIYLCQAAFDDGNGRGRPLGPGLLLGPTGAERGRGRGSGCATATSPLC